MIANDTAIDKFIGESYVPLCTRDMGVFAEQCKLHDANDEYVTPLDVIVLHWLQASMMDQKCGLRDAAVLDSAVARQWLGRWETIHEQAATLLYGIVKNHPFVDGNKRTAVLVVASMLGHVEVKGAFEDLVVRVAENPSNGDDAVVMGIAADLRHMFQPVSIVDEEFYEEWRETLENLQCR